MNLIFKMGEFEAQFPIDRMYAKNHMWAKKVSETTLRFGLAAYAVRLLQDVYFLDWDLAVGTSVQQGDQIGDIESSKAESSLHAPLSGTLSDFNRALLKDPSAINVDKYDTGWLFEIKADAGALLSPEEYLEHLEAVWEVTQKTIKGQLNH
ncbi:MAG: glycine cleavage system protein H [Planctomycetota bacterium]|nr:glycine cleavage system protein H [Planctomycetota bacterium]